MDTRPALTSHTDLLVNIIKAGGPNLHSHFLPLVEVTDIPQRQHEACGSPRQAGGVALRRASHAEVSL